MTNIHFYIQVTGDDNADNCKKEFNLAKQRHANSMVCFCVCVCAYSYVRAYDRVRKCLCARARVCFKAGRLREGCGGMCERFEGVSMFSALRAAFLAPWLISEGERERLG